MVGLFRMLPFEFHLFIIGRRTNLCENAICEWHIQYGFIFIGWKQQQKQNYVGIRRSCGACNRMNEWMNKKTKDYIIKGLAVSSSMQLHLQLSTNRCRVHNWMSVFVCVSEFWFK